MKNDIFIKDSYFSISRSSVGLFLPINRRKWCSILTKTHHRWDTTPFKCSWAVEPLGLINKISSVRFKKDDFRNLKIEDFGRFVIYIVTYLKIKETSKTIWWIKFTTNFNLRPSTHFSCNTPKMAVPTKWATLSLKIKYSWEIWPTLWEPFSDSKDPLMLLSKLEETLFWKKWSLGKWIFKSCLKPYKLISMLNLTENF